MLKPWLRITRLPLAGTAVCDVLACAALAWCAAGVDVAAVPVLDWVLLGTTSLLLYAVGMAANDLADRKVDGVKDPTRPLPSGDLRPAAVTVVVLLGAGGAVWLGGGARGWWLPVAAVLLFAGAYDFGPRKDDWQGPLLMGLARFSNASIAVWPLVLAGRVDWTLLLAPACIGLYAAAITAHSQTEDRDDPRRVRTGRVLTVLAFCGAAVLVWVIGGLPTLGVTVAFGVSSSTLVGRTPKPGPVKKQVLEMLLGLYWLAAVLAGGAHDGSLQVSLVVAFAALVGAWLLAIGSQLLIRWLRKPAPTAPSDMGPQAA